MKITRILIALAIIISPALTYSQDPVKSEKTSSVIIRKLASEINFDGMPDEEAWKTAEPFELIMYSPLFGKTPSEKSDIRIGYDSKYVYVGAKLFCNDPSIIQSASFKRDYLGKGGDMFGIMLDTYNDKENSVAFFVSPDATRFDASIQRDAMTRFPTDLPMNISYNTFWDVMTRQDSKGWYAEIRIPVSSLRFQVVNEEIKMGLTIERWIPAKNEVNIYPAIPPNWGENSVLKPSQAKEVTFNGIKPSRPLYIAPYALAGYDVKQELNSDQTGYNKNDKPMVEAGLDIKYGVTPNLVLDLTANTDFAQVESDDQQINLTRFSLYYPEKRLFFLERASVLDFNLSGNNNLFYSRRIGMSEEGDPIRIYGGARLTGRIGKWDVGILDMQTAPLQKKNSAGFLEELSPSENFGVMRFRRQVINQNSYIGAMTTTRLGADGSYNIAYGLDGIFRMFGNDYLDLKWAQVFENGVSNKNFKDPLRLSALWERRSNKGLGYELGYTLSGNNFNPGIGFLMIEDYTSIRANLSFGFLPSEKSKLFSHSFEFRNRYMAYIDDGSVMTYNPSISWKFQSKKQWLGDISLNYSVENLRDTMYLNEDNVFISTGTYRYLSYRGNLSTPGSKPFFVVMKSEGGQYFDGNRFSAGFQPTWNLSKHFEIGGTYNFDYVSFSIRNQEMFNHIIGFKGLYMLNTRLSVNAFIQYNTSVNEIISNFRLRYNPKEGNDFYIVFDEGRNTSLDREVPSLPAFSGRSIMVKYSYTFNL